MSPLVSQEKEFLLRLARYAVERATQQSPGALAVEKPSGRLGEPGGAFVTLRRGKHLRGCLGQLEAGNVDWLAVTVAMAARAAATEDPRFEPVRADEVAELTIEISVLTPFEEISPEKVVPGTHGLVIQQGNRRGLLLPQVATEHGLSRERFLEETCVKAGLPRDAWRDAATRVFAFTAEVFSEAEYAEKKSGADSSSAPR
jgi:AmmeMemoRadiSam system protein A